MNIKSGIAALTCAAGLFLWGALPASAIPISGTATITGFDTIDGTSLANNTMFNFFGTPSVSPSGSGDLATFVTTATATMNVDPWTFIPLSGALASPFLTMTNGTDTVVFNLDTSVAISNRTGNATNSALELYLLGTLVPTGPDFVGLDPSAASITFAATAAGTVGGFTISLSAPPAPPPVPEPATIALLGAGLAAAGMFGRRKAKADA